MKRNPIPNHVAIIMDGNGRFARSKGYPRIVGHSKGVRRIREVLETSKELGIKILTLYAFSAENWKRPVREVNALMKLLEKYLKEEIVTFKKNNIIFRVIGDESRFSLTIKNLIEEGVRSTKNNTGLTLNLALNYGARQEILRAVNLIIKDGCKKIDDTSFNKYLYTRNQPDPDLLIRTGGDMRVSNFLLWQIAYTELMVLSKFWPSFTKNDFIKAIEKYRNIERRFGA